MFESVSVEFMAYMAGFAKVKVWVDGNERHYSRDVMNDPEHNTKDSVSSVHTYDALTIGIRNSETTPFIGDEAVKADFSFRKQIKQYRRLL